MLFKPSFEVFVPQVHLFHLGTQTNILAQILVTNGSCCHFNHQNHIRELVLMTMWWTKQEAWPNEVVQGCKQSNTGSCPRTHKGTSGNGIVQSRLGTWRSNPIMEGHTSGSERVSGFTSKPHPETFFRFHPKLQVAEDWIKDMVIEMELSRQSKVYKASFQFFPYWSSLALSPHLSCCKTTEYLLRK